ncbi:MAG: GreA/GreB family elongation factor [Planctomycetes bacterium]|jgi:regulator of nucleoside diphosphate kinase|nr:GreA/GreB family elongation factor [Planctomycetota bacterium]
MTAKTMQQITDRKVQQIAARAIAATPLETGRCYHLCWWEGRPQCLHVRHTKEHHPSFFAANGYVFTEGLNVHQWRLVVGRVRDFCRSRRLALERRETQKAAVPRETLHITEFDAQRLRSLIDETRLPGASVQAHVDRLQEVLESAQTIPPGDVPRNVVTTNSRVRLRDDRRNEEITCSLVFPHDAGKGQDSQSRSVSVLSPIGVSILGRPVGHTIRGRIRVEELLYQPEAAGDFHRRAPRDEAGIIVKGGP